MSEGFSISAVGLNRFAVWSAREEDKKAISRGIVPLVG
jgi:hypothetical protein